RVTAVRAASRVGRGSPSALRGRPPEARAPGRVRGGRGHHRLPQRTLPRPLPWTARTGNGAHPALQAAEYGVCLLARGFPSADAAAQLRNGLVHPEGSRGLPASVGGGEEA